MTALEGTFIALTVAAFGATAWITGIVLWRVVKAPKR